MSGVPTAGAAAVVITDVAAVHASTTRTAAEQRADAATGIWAARAERVDRGLRSLGGNGYQPADPFRGVFLQDPFGQVPVTCLDTLPEPLATTGERLSLHLMETLVARADDLGRRVHLTTADPLEDVSKQTFVTATGSQVPAEHAATFFDPLGIYRTLRGVGHASVSRVVEASASGVVALAEAADRIRYAPDTAGLVTAVSGKSIALPFETTPLGAGPNRSALPFSDAAGGHYNAEGGIGLALRAADPTRPHLAQVAGCAYGTFGSAVVNRQVVTDVVLGALREAGIEPDVPVLVDLYGRGNPIDDAAELAAVERVQREYPRTESAYLKGDTHYVIGAHGLQGLARLLQRRAAGAPVSDLAAHPRSALLAGRPVRHLWADPADFGVLVLLAYSIHGSCVAVVVDLRDGAVATRGAVAGEVAA